MLSHYCSDNVEFTARSEMGIGPSEVWIAAQVSISKMPGNNRYPMVQSKAETDVNILYSEVIAKQVKLAFDEESFIIILRHPRMTPKDVNEYKLKFANALDFCECLTTYTTARVDALKATVDCGTGTAKGSAGKLKEPIVEAEPKAVVVTEQHAGADEQVLGLAHQGGVAQIFGGMDFSWL